MPSRSEGFVARGQGTSAASSRNKRFMVWGKPRAVDPHPSSVRGASRGVLRLAAECGAHRAV
eukprot:8054193-Alexandrium_andersonii.AAC.1